MGVYSLSKSSVNNWVKYSNAAAGNGQISDMELIGSQLLTSSQASVAFANLQNYTQYKHLQIRALVRTDLSANNDSLGLRFNGDSSAIYAEHVLYGNGSSVTSAAGTSQTFMSAANITGNTAAANLFGGGIIDIFDFQSTSKNKTLRSLTGNLGAPFIQMRSGLWISTAAVTSISLYSANGAPNLLTGSRFSLYGVK